MLPSLVYDRPAVYSGDIRVGYDAFSKIMKVDPDLHDVSRRAFDAGRLFANQKYMQSQ